jgi:hypothetical protein
MAFFRKTVTRQEIYLQNGSRQDKRLQGMVPSWERLSEEIDRDRGADRIGRRRGGGSGGLLGRRGVSCVRSQKTCRRGCLWGKLNPSPPPAPRPWRAGRPLPQGARERVGNELLPSG